MDPNRIKAVDAFIKSNGITPRSAWGASEAKIPDEPGSYDWNYNTVVIHHSGRSGDTSPVSVQNKHMKKNGWQDVGYHCMIGPGGQVYEGRRLYYKGSHTELANTGKIGILIMGNFEREFGGLLGGKPSAIQIAGAKKLVKSLRMLFPSLAVLGGHKDFKVKTECPGNQLYPLLDDMRKETGLLGPLK